MAALKVVQWATGNIGTKSLRAVIEHPDLELAGVYVYGADKVGVDAGTLCGLDPIGVTATNDANVIRRLGVNCVLYMPRQLSLDELCPLLESGANVVTTRGEFHHPPTLAPDIRDLLEGACAIGNSSLHSTGSSPGFITEAVPLVLSSLQRRVDRITIDEFADLSRRPSPDLLFNIMGFAKPHGQADQRRAAHLRDAFGPSLRTLADSLGASLDDVTSRGELAMARADLDIAAGHIPAGTVAAQRTVISGLRHGREFLRFTANWYCTTDTDPRWDLQSTGWRVRVEGDTPLDVTLHMPVPLERMADTAPGYTAHRAVNSIAAVCAARPGIRTTTELGHVMARLS